MRFVLFNVACKSNHFECRPCTQYRFFWFFFFYLSSFLCLNANAKHGKCLLTNLLPKFAIQMVQGDNRYNLKVMYNVLLYHTKKKKENNTRIKRKKRGWNDVGIAESEKCGKSWEKRMKCSNNRLRINQKLASYKVRMWDPHSNISIYLMHFYAFAHLWSD